MAYRIADYQAVQPSSRTNGRPAVRIPHTPRRLRLATIRLNVPRRDDDRPDDDRRRNRKTVELLATVGVKGVRNIAQLRFRMFRPGRRRPVSIGKRLAL